MRRYAGLLMIVLGLAAWSGPSRAMCVYNHTQNLSGDAAFAISGFVNHGVRNIFGGTSTQRLNLGPVQPGRRQCTRGAGGSFRFWVNMTTAHHQHGYRKDWSRCSGSVGDHGVVILTASLRSYPSGGGITAPRGTTLQAYQLHCNVQ